MKTFEQRKQNVEKYMHQIHKRRRKALITATSFCVAFAILALVLFIPLEQGIPDVSKYQNDPYYALIQKINQATYRPPKYENRFEMLKNQFGGLKGAAPGRDELVMEGTLAVMPDSMDPSGYVEVTDNQVAGVIEGDLFKRTDRYLFYLRNKELSVYSIAQEASTLVGRFTLEKTALPSEKEDQNASFRLFEPKEMYLSMDGTVVTILVNSYHSSLGYCTEVISLDVSDPGKITETNRIFMTGAYNSSRMVGNRLLVMSRYSINAEKIDFDRPETFVPQVGGKDALLLVQPENIVSTERLSHLSYTVITELDVNNLQIQDSAAVLGYSEQLYVSQDTIYATCATSVTTQPDENGYYSTRTQTRITGIGYGGEQFTFLGSIDLDGSLKDQYSMDQYNGVLRVVTSTSSVEYQTRNDDKFSSVTMVNRLRNVNLTCIDMESWGICAQVESFAPNGEDAQSVRFDGDRAYVCTAEVISFSDPVYFFDLSDLENITYTDTGTIDGYSTSLIQLGDGYLLGIGFGDADQLKIEVYEQQADAVVSVCSYLLDASFSSEYKSYYIDRENDMIGLPVMLYIGKVYYKLLHFDGFVLTELASTQCLGGLNDVRATIIDGYLYILHSDFSVEQIW